MDIGFIIAWIVVPAMLIMGGGTVGSVGLLKAKPALAVPGFGVVAATVYILIRRFL